VTGYELEVKGEQEVTFHIGEDKYFHQFLVCHLPIKEAGIIGMDFLLRYGAQMDFGKGQLKFKKAQNFRHGSLERRNRRADGTADHSSLMIYSTLDNHRICWDWKDRCRTQVKEAVTEVNCCDPVAGHFSKQTQEATSFLVKTLETVKIEPRARQIVVGILDIPKRQEPPELVCVEPAQIPLEGIIAARSLSRVHAKMNDREERQTRAHMTSPNSCWPPSRTAAYVHVMVANFSKEEIVLPKATIVGVAEEIMESLVASINGGAEFESRGRERTGKSDRTVKVDDSFRSYVKGKLSHLSPQERKVLEPVLLKYRHVFHEEGSNDFKGTDLVEHEIITGDAEPIRRPPYRVPFSLRQEMDRQVQDMLKKGVIRESTSPWSAPAILVPKKSPTGSRSFRFCIDFRMLNSVTKFDTYPLPVFEETVSTLYGSRYFTVLDCYSGFWQINIKEDSKCKTAFSVPGSGHYEFNRLPYGLSNSPSSFQRLMDVVLKNLTGTECWVFIDDIILFSDTIEEHAKRLEHVLQRFERASLQLQPGKCVFAQSQVQYLGYIISRDGISPSSDKVKAVKDNPLPKSTREVKFF
jgi:hypothetical protein